jgi:splicing factor U2AF 35 kDa subunit
MPERQKQGSMRDITPVDPFTPNYRPLLISVKVYTSNPACCRQYENNECTRGGFCNFMHIKVVSPAIKKDLFQAQVASLKILKPQEPASGLPPRAGGGSYSSAGRDDFRGGSRGGRSRY